MKDFFLIANYSLISFYGVLNLIFCFSSEKAIAEETISNTALTNLVNPTSNQSREQTSKNQKPKFPNRGIPTGRRRGGTSRSECSQTNKSLTAIVPGVEIPEANTTSHNSLSEPATQTSFADSKSFLTRTLEEYPTFWVYVPKLVDSSIKGEFILQDDQDNDIYRTYLNLPNKGGIINISLPNRPQNSLKIGQKYHWYVKIFCNEQNESAKYVFVDAWLERIAISPKLERQLNTANADRYQIFIDNNIWHDAISNLAEIQQTNKQEQTDWNQLLSDLGLSDLIEKNVLNIRANYPTK